MLGEASHVHLVNDGLGGRPAKRRVAFPIVSLRIDDHALHRGRSVVTFAARGFAGVIPGNGDAAAVRIQEDFGGIKAHAAGGIVRPLDAVAIKLSRLNAGYECVPVVVSSVGRRINRDHARRLGVIFAIEKHQIHAGSAAGINAEIDARRNNCGAQRRASAGTPKSLHDFPTSSFAAAAPLAPAAPLPPCSARRVPGELRKSSCSVALGLCQPSGGETA